MTSCAERRFLGSRRLLRFLTFALCTFFLCIFVIASSCLLISLSPCRAEDGESMPGFRRMLLPAERLSEEMKRVQDGVLVRVPLADFQALVAKATRATARKTPPRLLEARYHAALKEEALYGEAQWKLVHKGPGPGLLKLEPFNLALRQARFENGDALIAAFDGKTPALLVETAGERTVSLDWSARAESGPDGLQFHLEVPSCPVAVLELDIPVGREAMVLNDGALLTGPHEADTAELRRWKIVCGGRRSVDVRILPADRVTPNVETTIWVRQKTVQKLHPEGVEATFELTLDGLARGVRELVCACDPELRLRDVVGPSVDSCSFQNGDDKKPSRLTIRLRQPQRAGTWQIRCLAPLNRSPSPGGAHPIAWRSPGLHLVNGISRGESLTLWLHPDLRVETWEPGQFRLVSSELERSTGGQVLTLSGGGLGPVRRPEAHVRVNGVEYRVQQFSWLRCDASGMALTVQIGWEISQGQLFQLPVRLPAQWDVDKVELTPTGLLRDWRVRGPTQNATLLVDLAAPLGDRSTGDGETTPRPIGGTRARLPLLTIHLKPGWSGPFAGKKLAFPDAAPVGARFREGALALDCDGQMFHLDVSTAAERTEAESDGPWGGQLPEYYYRYKGQPAAGEFVVRPRPPRVRAKCATEVFLAADRSAVEAHLLLEAEVGSPNAVELSLSAGDGAPWSWRNEATGRGEETPINRVRRLERLYGEETSALVHVLAARNPLQKAIAIAAYPAGERWRLTLARPLRAREPLRLQASHSLQPRDNRWEVPLVLVPSANRMEGEVKLHLTAADLVQLKTLGLRETATTPSNNATPWRTFRYGQNPVGLSLTGPIAESPRSTVAVIDRARLLTYVGSDGVLRHHFSFQVANWNEHTLTLRLPTGARPLAVQVDGHWLPRLIPVAVAEDSGEPREMGLPVPAREDSTDSVHRFEIVYAGTRPNGTFWQTLDAPAPDLPHAPLSFRRIWRLPSNRTPLYEERYQVLPGTNRSGSPMGLPHRFADLFHLPQLWERFDPLLEDRQAAVRETLERAIRELRAGRTDRTMSMREMLSDLALGYLKDRYTVVLDAPALSEARVTPQTSVNVPHLTAEETPPPWSACGLIAVPARSGILLTTVYGCGASLREPLSEDVENALTLATRSGQDPSGRFHTVLSWLHLDDVSDLAGDRLRTLDFESERTDWSEWEPIAGRMEDRLIVVRRDVVTATGLALVVALGFVFWLLRRRSVRRRLTLLLLALGCLGLCVTWLPAALRDLAWWPLLATGFGAAVWYVRVVVRMTNGSKITLNRPKKAGSAAAIAGLLALVFFGWHSRAAAPMPATVYLLPSAADAPGKQTVLAPADLLDRLKTLTQPTPLESSGPWTVLLDATYEGRSIAGQAEFRAVFSAYSQTDEASSLALPLAGVQLMDDVLLDGARVAPLALPAPQVGYSLPLRGRGRHKIEVRFRTPIVGTVEDRNVLFTVPPLSRSHLSWHIPSGAIESQVLVKYGAQWTTRAADGEHLESDLGALPRPLHLHWYQPAHPPSATYRAAYLWELGLDSNRLTASLRYRVDKGAVKTLEFDLPDDLEVVSASAQRVASATLPSWLARFSLRDWQVRRIDNKRRLFLEFPYPICGNFQVALELLPRRFLTSPAALPLPTPRGVRAAGSHYLAYRTHLGLNAQRDTSKYLTRIAAEGFAADWPDGPRLDADFPGVVYRITPDHFPQLVLRLGRTPPLVESNVDLTVQTGTHFAEILAVADIKAPNKDLEALEWELAAPGCTIVSVAGDDVRTWKQNGSRLLVWLNRTTATTRVQFSGWLPLKLSGSASHLELNGPFLRSTATQRTRLHLLTGGDLVLSEVATRNLQPVSPSGSPRRTSEQERTFETSESSFQVRCQIRAAANAVARVLTFAEVQDRELRFTSIVNYRVTHGELRRVHLRLRNWEGDKVEVQAKGTASPATRRTAGEFSWLLPLPAGITGDYRVTLSGSIPLDEAALGVRMPEVVVQGVEKVEYFLAVVGDALAAQARGSLQAMKSPRPQLESSWPDETKHLEHSAGLVWLVRGSEWQLHLLPQRRSLESAPLRVFLLEQSATVLDGRCWMHEARCWLRHEAHADLNLDFPAAARILAATVDGVEVTPFALGAARVWLPLPGQSGVRCVRFRWLYDRPEPLDRPNLTPPHVLDAIEGPTLWTVRIPAGWDATGGAPASRLGVGGPRVAALALYCAEAQFHICQDLAEQKRDRDVSAALTAAQQRCEQYCRQARLALAQTDNLPNVKGPKGQTPTDWLAELTAANRALADGNGDNIREASVPFSAPAAGGVPMSWQAQAGGDPPRLQLMSRAERRTRQALAASVEWGAGSLVVWLLSLVPFLRRRLRLLWPEQVALLGLLGWHLAGPTTIVMVLFATAVCGRLFLLVRGLRALLNRRRPQVSTMNAGSGMIG
jgi:hypothetical protein